MSEINRWCEKVCEMRWDGEVRECGIEYKILALLVDNNCYYYWMELLLE